MLRVLSLLPHVAALLFAHTRVSSAFVPLSSISTGGANTNNINSVGHKYPTLFAVSGSHRSSSDNNENNVNVNANVNANNNNKKKNNLSTRQDFFIKTFLATTTTFTTLTPQKSFAKCTDIESCREIGEKKVEQDMIENPTVRLKSGVRYKVLQPGMVNGGSGGNGNGNGNDTELSSVNPNSNIDLIFSVSTLSGGYMYSRGFGFEKIDIGDGKLQSDIGLDSLRVQLGKSDKDVPLGIEDALIGMKKGERRRVELPPNVGFETSQWRPEPTTRRGKTRIVGYRQLLEGNGSTRPPFPAATIWDIEVLKIRK
jgi:hypothetical protein